MVRMTTDADDVLFGVSASRLQLQQRLGYRSRSFLGLSICVMLTIS